MSISPRVRLITPVDVTSLLPGNTQTSYITRDISSFLPDPQAEAVLMRMRSSHGGLASGNSTYFQKNGTTMADNFWHIKSRLQSSDGSPLIPATLVWGSDFWVRVDVLNKFQTRRDTNTAPATQSLTLLGYGMGGKCYIPIDPVDVTSLLPGDSQITPLTRDFTSSLPSGVDVSGLVLSWIGQASSGVKHLHARETGSGLTSDVLTQVTGANDLANLERGELFHVKVNTDKEADVWFKETGATSEGILVLHGYFPEGVRG